METKLKPCPFCGDIPDFMHCMDCDDSGYITIYLECCVRMETYYRKGTPVEEADKYLIERWNHRHDLRKEKLNRILSQD